MATSTNAIEQGFTPYPYTFPAIKFQIDECINCGDYLDEGTHCPECNACGANDYQFCECEV